MKALRIFLLVLIIAGLALLATQNMWVPKLVKYILEQEQEDEVMKGGYFLPIENKEGGSVTDTAPKMISKEECIDLGADKVCARQSGVVDDYWGRQTNTEIFVVNLSGSRTSMRTMKGFAPSVLAVSSDKTKVYYSKAGYEGAGQGEMYLVDIRMGTMTDLPIDVHGESSNDKKYYASTGELLSGTGLQVCHDNVANITILPASAIRVLNFDTGEVNVVLEDKDYVFQISGWGMEDEHLLFYSKSKPIGEDAGGCLKTGEPTHGDIRVS
jgi:hypothetical protein